MRGGFFHSAAKTYCAITRKGQLLEDRASCAKCLYVNRDFLRRISRGDDGWKACEDDMMDKMMDEKAYFDFGYAIGSHSRSRKPPGRQLFLDHS
jgi:hypothetical protein